MIQRHIKRLILEDLTYFPAIGIIGTRQIGKTTLAKSIASELQKPVLYLDVELDTDRRRLENAESFLQQYEDHCVIIDEIQLLPSLFSLLRSLIDMKREPSRFILLGSASPELIKGASESLAGRIAYSELNSFSITEVNFEKKSDNAQKLWIRGGFPLAYLAPSDVTAFRWLRSFIQTFIFRDLNQFGINVSSTVLSKLLEMLVHLHGNLLNAADLAKSLGVTSPTVTRYLDILEGAFIIHRLQPYHANTTKRLVKSPKLYFRDSGIVHSLARIQNYHQLTGNPIVGHSWEGFVIEQIRTVLGADWQYYFYRTHAGAECDLFLISPNDKKICIEIKLSNSASPSKGFFESVKDLNPDEQYLIVPKMPAYVRNDGLVVLDLEAFFNLQSRI